MKTTINNNLKRVDDLINTSFITCSCCNLPMPSWIELSIIDFCNRKCVFCPKSNDLVAPNQSHLYMDINLVKKLINDLYDIKFCGNIVLAGYGEPMFSPIYLQIIEEISKHFRIELVTNGDLLNIKNIKQLITLGTYINVSVYDKDRLIEIQNLFRTVDIPEDRYILRDRWYSETDDFGIKLTNRAGLVNIGNQTKIDKTAKCFYPFYSITIDWNGDVLLCPQDWNRRIKFGNIAYNSVHDIWIGSSYNKYRELLYSGNRNILPCKLCNCDGIHHGILYANNFIRNKND